MQDTYAISQISGSIAHQNPFAHGMAADHGNQAITANPFQCVAGISG